jgi:hypothetical protein
LRISRSYSFTPPQLNAAESRKLHGDISSIHTTGLFGGIGLQIPDCLFEGKKFFPLATERAPQSLKNLPFFAAHVDCQLQ